MLRFFNFVHRVSRWFRLRLTASGRLLAAVMIAGALFGMDTKVSMAHAVFTGALLLLLVGFVLRGSLRQAGRALHGERRFPKFVTVGTPTEYRLRIRNASSKPVPALAIEERLWQALPEPAAFARRRSRSGNWFDRRVGYPDFVNWLRRLRRVEVRAVQVPRLLPGQSLDLQLTLDPVQRGVAVFSGFRLTRPDPLGLWRALAETANEAALVVLPRTYPVAWPESAGGRHHQPGGIAQASRVGDSEEFRSLRDYRPGDPLRSIHWRSWARTGKPVVREQQDEYFARHALILDTATETPFADDFEAAVSIAASFAVARRGADSLLDLLFVGAETQCITIGRGLGHADAMLRVLAAVVPSPPDRFQALARAVLTQAKAMSSAVLVLQRWDRERADLIAGLRARAIGLRIFVVADARSDAADAPELAAGARRVRPDAIEQALR